VGGSSIPWEDGVEIKCNGFTEFKRAVGTRKHLHGAFTANSARG
jgi:hypothetical protein